MWQPASLPACMRMCISYQMLLNALARVDVCGHGARYMHELMRCRCGLFFTCCLPASDVVAVASPVAASIQLFASPVVEPRQAPHMHLRRMTVRHSGIVSAQLVLMVSTAPHLGPFSFC